MGSAVCARTGTSAAVPVRGHSRFPETISARNRTVFSKTEFLPEISAEFGRFQKNLKDFSRIWNFSQD